MDNQLSGSADACDFFATQLADFMDIFKLMEVYLSQWSFWKAILPYQISPILAILTQKPSNLDVFCI